MHQIVKYLCTNSIFTRNSSTHFICEVSFINIHNLFLVTHFFISIKPNAKEGIYELFRILDNFNLPQGPGAAEGEGESTSDDLMRSSTWTTAWNLTDLKLPYTT